MTTKVQVRCRRCGARDTHAKSGVCILCRADDTPAVQWRDPDGLLWVGGQVALTADAARRLALKIVDALEARP
ncbi:MAG: hypothetical protein U0R81_16565 [Mycobacterium sp.]|nr:hypothetical protein [Mycobacterium sp.]